MALSDKATGFLSILSTFIVILVIYGLTISRDILENWYGWLWIIPIISILLGILLFYFIKLYDNKYPNVSTMTFILGFGMFVGGILMFIFNSIIYFVSVARQNTHAIRSIS